MKAAFTSLRARVALLVLLAVLPLLALSIYNNLRQRRLAGERAGESAERLVHLAINNQGEIVEGTRQLLIALSQLSEIQSHNTDDCNQMLARIRGQSVRYANLGVIDANGIVTCSALPFSGGIDLTDRSYFREAIEQRTFSIGEYQVGRITQQSTINFGYPIFAANGAVGAADADASGVVFAALDLTWLNELAGSLALEEGVVIFTVDKEGTILTHYPQGERIMGQMPDDLPLIATIRSGETQTPFVARGFDDVERLYAFAPLEAADESGVRVAAGIPTTTAYADANRELLGSLASLAFLTLLFLAAAWAFADRFVLGPVQRLTRASQRLSSGDMEARTGLHYDESELGRLAATFDQMASSLESRLRRLQALNAIDRAITARYDLPQTLNVVLDQVIDQLDVDAAAVLLLDGKGKTLDVAAGRGFRDPELMRAHLPLDDSYSGRVAALGQPIYVADLQRSPDMHASPKAAEGFVSYAGAPLALEGELLGVLGVYHRSPLALDTEWRNFLEALSLQAAIAIDNAHLLRQTRRLIDVTRQQARQVQQIVDTLPEGVALLNNDHRLLLANPLATRYLAQLAPAPAERSTEGVLHSLGQRPIAEFLRPLREDEPWPDVALPNGQIYEIASQPVQHDDNVGGWVLVLRDVTEERQRQEYMHTQGRLATVGQLAAGIAHDFNNIMAIILLYSQALSRRPDHPRRDEYLTTIVSQAQRASRLINQILDFSRAGALERKELALDAFIDDTTHLLQRTMPESITIHAHTDDQNILVEADPTRLQQVLMNLVINARDAMPSGGRIDISLSTVTVAEDEAPPLPDLPPGAYACLTVADNGAGIAPQDLQRIFEPFFTTKPRGEGTGLGLAQVYGIVRQHGGAIEVQSSSGQGTTFTIYLPRFDPAARQEDAPPRKEATRAATDAPVAGRILLVEDNPATREAIADTLAELGYDVLQAEHGLQAMTILNREAESPTPGIDLVLSDIVMPEMDGIALHEAMRTSYPDLAFVFMSGYPLQRENAQPWLNERVRYLKKPFTAGELTRAIAEILNQPLP